MRLLHAGHAGRLSGLAEFESEPFRSADPRRHRRKPVPLYRLPADRRGGTARRRTHGEGSEMSALAADAPDFPFSLRRGAAAGGGVVGPSAPTTLALPPPPPYPRTGKH